MNEFRSKDAETFFVRSLMQWNQEVNTRIMPWKGEKDPYKVWLSEVILQQTRVAQGTPYYLKFLESYPDVFALASARDETVFRLWQGLGYYSRCRNLMATARMIVRDHSGIFPSTYSGLLGLPGVGDYTAAAVASLAFGLPHAVVDGNVIRVLSRFFGIDIPPASTEGKALFAGLAERLLDRVNPGAYNQALMDFGALICTPALPHCGECPLQEGCKAFLMDMTGMLPVKARKPAIPTRYFNYLVLRHKDQVYLRKRVERDIWQDLYEFPLVETTTPISVDQLMKTSAFKKWLAEKPFRLTGDSGIIVQKLTHRRICAIFYFIDLMELPSRLGDCIEVKKKDLKQYAFPGVIVSVLQGKNLTLVEG
jgi:A/G-specific adenine glycosylase